MAKKTEDILRNAIRLIKARKASKARPALVDLLRREPENAQGWYLLSFTLDDTQKQQYALLQALRISPDFEKARTRLANLRGEAPPSTAAPSFTEELREEVSAETEKPVPAFVVEKEEPLPKDEFSFSELTPNARNKPAKSRSKATTIFLGLVVVGLLLVAAWMFLPRLSIIAPTATPVASRTLPPTWTSSPVPPTATPSNSPIPTSTPTVESTTESSPTP